MKKQLVRITPTYVLTHPCSVKYSVWLCKSNDKNKPFGNCLFIGNTKKEAARWIKENGYRRFI